MRQVAHVFAGLFLALADSSAHASCGGNGQGGCIAIPPCEENLTLNSSLVCYHPNCGKHDQRACTPDVRLQPCDLGYLPDPAQGFKCVTPKETVAAKEIDRERRRGICRAAVGAVLSGKIPPELAAFTRSMVNQGAAGPVVSKLNSPEVKKAAYAFAERNVPLFKAMVDNGTAIKRQKNAFRALFDPDQVCGKRTPQQWIAALRTLGLGFEMGPVRLADEDGQPRLHPAALKPGAWIFMPNIGVELAVNSVRTFHSIAILIPSDGSWSQVIYVPSVSAQTPNIFLGLAGGLKVFWPPTSMEEHLPVGGELALGVSPTAIVEWIKYLLDAEGVVTPPSMLGVDITGALIWDNVGHKLFRGTLAPGGFSVEVSLGVEPLPIPGTVAAGIDGGIVIYQFP